MTKVLLTHPGTQYVYQLAKALYRNKLLYRFRTGFTVPVNSFRYFLYTLLPSRYKKKIANRILHEVPAHKVKNLSSVELNYLNKSTKEYDQETLLFERNKKFQERIPETEIRESDIVIGFDTSSWILIERVHRAGKKFILDQSIAHPESKEKIYKQLNQRYPLWSQQLASKREDLIRIEEQEHHLADKIVVASTFTKNTLVENGVNSAKIIVNPYGVDLEKFKLKEFKPNDKVQFIFIGSVTARKGLPYLFEVWNELNTSSAVLNIVGPCDEATKKLIPSSPSVNYLGKIPHHEMSKVIAENDVFIFPSFFEGFGLVILEAMAIGLPVITTNATAGPDVMREGKDGFIVDVFDKTAFVEKIRYFIDHPGEIKNMGMNAREQAEKFSWNAYGERWKEIINNITM